MTSIPRGSRARRAEASAARCAAMVDRCINPFSEKMTSPNGPPGAHSASVIEPSESVTRCEKIAGMRLHVAPSAPGPASVSSDRFR